MCVSCLTLCDPTKCRLPVSSVHGILQAKILEWAAISFFRGSSRPRGRTWVSHIACRCFTIWAPRGALTLCMQFLLSFISSCLKNLSLFKCHLSFLPSFLKWKCWSSHLYTQVCSNLTWSHILCEQGESTLQIRVLLPIILRKKQNNQSPSYTWKFQRTSTGPMKFSNLRQRPCLIPVFYFPGCLCRGFGRSLINICKYLSYTDWGF